MGLTLTPTYSFARRYNRGQELFPHRDRVECEHSATLHLAGAGDISWPIWLRLDDADPVSVDLRPGDALVYRGDRTALAGPSRGGLLSPGVPALRRRRRPVRRPGVRPPVGARDVQRWTEGRLMDTELTHLRAVDLGRAAAYPERPGGDSHGGLAEASVNARRAATALEPAFHGDGVVSVDPAAVQSAFDLGLALVAAVSARRLPVTDRGQHGRPRFHRRQGPGGPPRTQRRLPGEGPGGVFGGAQRFGRATERGPISASVCSSSTAAPLFPSNGLRRAQLGSCP